MSYKERVQILSDAEQSDFYNPPIFAANDQRFFFALNDQELTVANKLRNRDLRYMFVVLLGYFKAKPVALNPGFHQIKHDLKHVYQSVLMGPGFKPFNLSQKENERVYQEIFNLCEYQRWSIKSHRTSLVDYLTEQTKAWSAPRNLFDAAIEYFSGHKIAIPAYSTLGNPPINLKGIYNFELSEKLPNVEELMRSIEGYLPVKEKKYPLGSF
jgi:hypothetical protein